MIEASFLCQTDKEPTISHFYLSIPTPPSVLTQEEQIAILKVTGEHVSGFRDHMIISLGFATGMREHELAALTVGDVLDKKGSIRRHIILNTFKKATDKPAPQDVILSESVPTKLKKYLQWKKRENHDLSTKAPLFLSRKGNPLSTKSMRTMFTKWQKAAGFDSIYNFHSIRHSACTNLYRKTKDLRLVQLVARHKSIASTQRYAHPSLEELVAAVQNINC